MERNPLRANLVRRAEDGRWSSLWQNRNERCDVELHEWPLPRPADWLEYVNQPETEAELQALRAATRFSRPFGSPQWQREMAWQARNAQ